MKHCKRCNKRFKQRKSESNYAFKYRLTCSLRCQAEMVNSQNQMVERMRMREFWEWGMRALARKEGI